MVKDGCFLNHLFLQVKKLILECMKLKKVAIKVHVQNALEKVLSEGDFMKLTSCRKCFKAVPTNKTCIMDGLRICHDCKKEMNSLRFYNKVIKC